MMDHMRHRIALFDEIQAAESRVEALGKDITRSPRERNEAQQLLDAKRAELADYSREHAEAIVAEEVAVMDVSGEMVAQRDQALSQVEALENERDELLENEDLMIEQIEWLLGNAGEDVRAAYREEFPATDLTQDKGHTQ